LGDRPHEAVDLGAAHPWPLGDDAEETCLTEETASRALQLRDMVGDDYEDGR
jgi:hypothetical protein